MIFSSLFIIFMYFCSSVNCVESIPIRKIKDNMLRAYVFSYPKHVRKGIKNIKNYVFKTTDVVTIYMMEANKNYYSLSDDERTLIETIISLTY